MRLLILMLSFSAVFARSGNPEKVTATVTQSPLDKVAMKNSAYMNQYCSAADSRLSEDPYRSQFAPDLDQCLNRCNRDSLCTGVDYSAEKTCNQYKGTGRPGDERDWTHYHRRAKTEESCPEGTVQHVIAPSPYSKSFCVYADKKCPGHDLYKKSLNIADATKCMEKCAKIKSCASADFVDSKCNPKDYACTPAELVGEPDATFMQRLEAGETECMCSRGFTRDDQGVCQPDGPCSGSSPMDISGVTNAYRDGKILIQRNAPCGTVGRITFQQPWATYKAGFGSHQNTDIGYWAGLEFLHAITNNAEGDSYRLIVELPLTNGQTYYANYDNFVVSCEEDGYRLSVGAYSGNAGDALNKPHVFNRGTENGSPFSTYDVDNDDWNGHCADSFGAGWWFSSCFTAYPNGPCPGEPKYRWSWTVRQAWYNVAWGGNGGALRGTYMMIEKMSSPSFDE